MPDSNTSRVNHSDKIIVLFDLSDTLIDPATETALPGAKDLVEALAKRKIKMCVVTGTDSLTAKALLTVTGLANYFHIVVGNEISDSYKERLEIAITRARTMVSGLLSDPAIFVVDDTLSRIPVAEGMGVKFIAITPKMEFAQGQPAPYRAYQNLSDTREIISAITGKAVKKSGRRREKSIA